MAEIEFTDGAWRLPDGRPIRLGGEPVAHFNPGWHPTAAGPGPGGLTLLHLEHETSAHATWLLDPNLDHLPADPSAWPQPLRDCVAADTLPALESLRDTLLLTRTPTLAPAAHRFLAWDETLRRNLAALWANDVLHPPQHIHLTPDMGGLEIKTEAGRRLAILPHENLDAALATDLQERFLAALQSGALTWPSPFTGQPTPCNRSFFLSDFHFAYRFTDPTSGFDWFILASQNLCRALALWMPAAELLVPTANTTRNAIDFYFGNLCQMVMGHLVECGIEIAQTPTQDDFAIPIRSYLHIGHLLWNELSAIEPLIRLLPHRRLPTFLSIGAASGEVYGPLASLYPELADRIDTSLSSSRAVADWSYRQAVHVIRVSSEYVPAGLRERILQHVRVSNPVGELVPPPALIVVLGLRVENRTLVDLLRVFIAIVETILQDEPNCLFVVDGHNSKLGETGTSFVQSHGEVIAEQSPLAIERALAWGLRSWFADQPVRIIDTLGATLKDSLAWVDRADCFITIWGAGLAKYRWVANKPGLILTGYWNREHRGDLHIYDSPTFMETPTPVVFVPADLVQDRPDAPLLVDIRSSTDQPSLAYSNFVLDLDRFQPLLRRFITAVRKGEAAVATFARTMVIVVHHGSIDAVGQTITGWAATADGTPAQVTIEIDGRPAATLACDIARPDVHAAGFPTPTAGFSFALPPSLLDGAPHDLAILFPDGQPLPFNPATGVAGPLWRFQFTPAPIAA